MPFEGPGSRVVGKDTIHHHFRRCMALVELENAMDRRVQARPSSVIYALGTVATDSTVHDPTGYGASIPNEEDQ